MGILRTSLSFDSSCSVMTSRIFIHCFGSGRSKRILDPSLAISKYVTSEQFCICVSVTKENPSFLEYLNNLIYSTLLKATSQVTKSLVTGLKINFEKWLISELLSCLFIRILTLNIYFFSRHLF